MGKLLPFKRPKPRKPPTWRRDSERAVHNAIRRYGVTNRRPTIEILSPQTS